MWGFRIYSMWLIILYSSFVGTWPWSGQGKQVGEERALKSRMTGRGRWAMLHNSS